MTITIETERTLDAFVANNVHCCLSGICAELAKHDEELHTELYDHYETFEADGDGTCTGCGKEDEPLNIDLVCEQCCNDPVEIYEHWAVDPWFGRKLAAHGELVTNVFGVTVWGRQTTGQAIWLDGVIGEIYNELGR